MLISKRLLINDHYWTGQAADRKRSERVCLGFPYHLLRGALGGGGSSGMMPPELAVPEVPPANKSEVELVEADDIGRPGIAIENVWPSFRL
jgi:hypothetical protein